MWVFIKSSSDNIQPLKIEEQAYAVGFYFTFVPGELSLPYTELMPYFAIFGQQLVDFVNKLWSWPI